MLAKAPMHIQAAQLNTYVTKVFAAAGLPEAQASQVSDVLVWANLRGGDTHGVVRVPLYLDWIEQGVINPRAVPSFRNETSAACVLDADRAAGPVAMMLAADAAVGKAREAGLGCVLVARTTHTAALGYYARHVTEQQCVCIAFCGSGLHMPYHGTRDAAVSTSPICIGVPAAERGAVVLDMATSVISAGALLLARRTGAPLAPNAAIDREGRPTTDSSEAVLPLPMAGAKGAGLSLMIELVTGLLTRDPILSEALSVAKAGHRQNAMVLAIDIAKFTDPVQFAQGATTLAALISAMPRQPGFDAILMPGERGDRLAETRRRDGIPIPEKVWADLAERGRSLGVTPPSDLERASG